ncbi:Abi family protein (plasmid) [Microvirga terrae]|uniref:Abi family protein n=1 Tax=Microvirga terrae TaxID=2740529 RepID=A0ABY5S4G3_9HYPH|nr:Abi family protein [Microvirga terrae]UVF22852.1 Abi family protein [Microvirga terrae]
MNVTDEPRAIQYLERMGYYRLSGYWYPFRQSRLITGADGRPTTQIIDQFRQGTEFRHVVELYVFDKRLRLLFLDAIERIEVALRVDVALLLGARDPSAHRNPKELHGHFAAKINPRTGDTNHKAWLARLDENERRSREDFVKHFRAKYSSDLPIWIAIELWDFGMLSTFLSGMKVADQDAIAAKYNIPRRELLTSWMRAINHIRNICAHHSRLWNCSPSDQPKPPRAGEIPLLDHLANDTFAQTRLYAVAAVIQFLLRRINPTTSWATRLNEHFASFPQAPGIAPGQSGFPASWETLPLWT